MHEQCEDHAGIAAEAELVNADGARAIALAIAASAAMWVAAGGLVLLLL